MNGDIVELCCAACNSCALLKEQVTHAMEPQPSTSWPAARREDYMLDVAPSGGRNRVKYVCDSGGWMPGMHAVLPAKTAPHEAALSDSPFRAYSSAPDSPNSPHDLTFHPTHSHIIKVAADLCLYACPGCAGVRHPARPRHLPHGENRTCDRNKCSCCS